MMHLTVLAGWGKKEAGIYLIRLTSFLAYQLIFYKKKLSFCVSPITLDLCQRQTCIQPRGARQKGSFGRNWTDKIAASSAHDLMWHLARERPLQGLASSDYLHPKEKRNNLPSNASRTGQPRLLQDDVSHFLTCLQLQLEANSLK